MNYDAAVNAAEGSVTMATIEANKDLNLRKISQNANPGSRSADTFNLKNECEGANSEYCKLAMDRGLKENNQGIVVTHDEAMAQYGVTGEYLRAFFVIFGLFLGYFCRSLVAPRTDPCSQPCNTFYSAQKIA